MNYAKVYVCFYPHRAALVTCYFLLNYAWEPVHVARVPLACPATCYFLLNYAIVTRRVREWRKRNFLLFSFELCGSCKLVLDIKQWPVHLAIFFWIMLTSSKRSGLAIPQKLAIFFWIMLEESSARGWKATSGDLAIFFWIMLCMWVLLSCCRMACILLFSFELCPIR